MEQKKFEKIMELETNDSHNSFYGKAIVVQDMTGWTLYSYGTAIVRISNGKAARLWDGYSATTMRHIQAFCDKYGVYCGGKKWWEGVPTNYTMAKEYPHRVFKGRVTKCNWMYTDFYPTEY